MGGGWGGGGERFTTYDKRTFTKVLDADKGPSLLQTLGNTSNDAMFDYKSGFRQSEDKRNLHLHSDCHIYLTFQYHLLYFCL